MLYREHQKEGVKSYARYSDCEKYRYTLTRVWDPTKPKVVFIGLNPSTATELKNDPTVTRMCHFAKAWDYGSITVCNIFAYRATFPKDLKQQADPIGAETDHWLKHEIATADNVIAAWGNHGVFQERSATVKQLLTKDTFCFGLTKSGEPKHVLYLSNQETLKPFIQG